MSYNKKVLSQILDKLEKPTKFRRPHNQWQDPGEITTIPGNQITMDGVSYPVYAQPNVGQPQMMYPDQQYYFPDASEVTEYPVMAGGGYVVTRSSDRKGKTHKVTGPDGTVKYFGDSKLGQHPKDPERKKAFYARHKKNLAGNPYFRAFARKTWADGGQTPDEREMVNGIADILSQVRDAQNRAAIAENMIQDFKREKVSYDQKDFLAKAKLQLGGTPYVDSVFNANKTMEWVQRLYQKNGKSIMVPGQTDPSTHFMESGNGRVYPTVVTMADGSLKYLGKDAYDYADSTKTYIQFPNDKQAQWFGKNYKMGTGVLSKHQSGGTLLQDKTNYMKYQKGGLKSKNGWDASDNPEFVNAMQQEWLNRPATKAMFAQGKKKPALKKYTDADMAASLDAVMAQQNYGHYGFPFAPAMNPMLPPTAQGLEYTIPSYPFADGGGVGESQPTVDSKTYQQVKQTYYDLLNKQGQRKLTDKMDLQLLSQSHKLMTDNMRFYEKGKYFTTEPFVDAASQIKNTVRGIYNDVTGRNYATGGTWAAPNFYEGGGEMIKRADGSYSRRGLWDNIRANKGSGKKPTKEMLAQEKKIRREEMMYGGEYANGGTNNPGFDALPKFVQAKILSNMGYGGYHNPVMQQGGYKPLSQQELSALAHQFRGMGSSYLSSQPYVMEHQSIKNELGNLTPRERGQLSKFMQGNSTLEAIYQAMPNFLGASGAAELPTKSRLRDSMRKDYFQGKNGYQDWINYMEKQGYENGGEVMDVTPAEAERLRQQGYQFEIIG